MPMKIGDKPFFDRVNKGLDDSFMRGSVVSAQERLKNAKTKSSDQLGNWEDWREQAEEIRQHTLENLDYYLEQLATNVKKAADIFSLHKPLKKPMTI